MRWDKQHTRTRQCRSLQTRRGLTPSTTYHYRLLAKNEVGSNHGEDRTFTTLPAGKVKEETGGGNTELTPGSGTEPTAGGSSSGGGVSNDGSSIGTNLVTGIESNTGTNPVVSEKAIEKVLLGCSTRPLALNDVLQKGDKVLLIGAAERTQAGKQVKIVFGSDKVVATATVGSNGEFSTTALYRLTSSVAQSRGSRHSFATYSLPCPPCSDKSRRACGRIYVLSRGSRVPAC